VIKIDNGKKLSLIIPYYKTYELTRTLLKGLQVQLTDEVEVIVIDDGCNEKRLDEFKSDLIRVEHQTNKGTAKTRNRGIKEAKGKYIGFIDCDDTITMDYIETLLNAIDKTPTEVINFNWLDLSLNKVICRPTNPAMWKAIYRNDVIPLFREDLLWGEEDVDFQIEVQKMETTFLDRVLYIYNSNRVGSLFWEKTHQKKGE
jgi:glycosyltransferase involved in cell wall biosynthesis